MPGWLVATLLLQCPRGVSGVSPAPLSPWGQSRCCGCRLVPVSWGCPPAPTQAWHCLQLSLHASLLAMKKLLPLRKTILFFPLFSPPVDPHYPIDLLPNIKGFFPLLPREDPHD